MSCVQGRELGYSRREGYEPPAAHLVHSAAWCLLFTGLRQSEDTVLRSVKTLVTRVGKALTRNSMKPSVFPACRGRAVGMINCRLSMPSSLIRSEVFVEFCKAFAACAIYLNR